MHRLFTRCAVLVLSSASFFGNLPAASAQNAAAVERSVRVAGRVDAGQTVRLSGHVPVFADAIRIPSTSMAPNAKFAHLILLMSRAPAVQAAFDQLLADQVNPSSPRFHQWLTPAQVGTLYGPAQADVDAVTRWLQGQGLTVNSVAPSRLYVDFSGPVASVETAFDTSFRLFSLSNGEQRYSLVQEPAVPAALQPVISSIAGLSQTIHRPRFRSHSLTEMRAQHGGNASPDYTSSSGTYHYLLSGDFNTAYDITSVLAGGTTGSGENVAVIGESRVAAADIAQLEALEGIATKQPNVIIPSTGADPGITADDAEAEATLDVDRVVGTAPGAGVDLIVSTDIGAANTYGTDGLFIGINYEISTVNDPIMSISFGGCEYLDQQSNTTTEASFFATAAAEGITTFVSSGDNGAAACNFDYPSKEYPTYNAIASINDLCSSPNVTCVGGTEFAGDVSSPSSYWSSTNSSTFSSLQSYIPEGAWNDPYFSGGNYSESGGTGGGSSVYIARPSWQTGTGVPAGNFRLVPDLSFTASDLHDGFIVCIAYNSQACATSGSYLTNAAVFGGTSADAPSMAGIQALVDQRLGVRQGNINPTLYSLGNAGTAFHDVTVATSGVTNCVVTTPSLCNNSTPAYTTPTGGLSGYTVNAGYDEVTGWGSLDVAQYVAAVAGTTSFTISPTATTLTTTSGTAVSTGLTLRSFGSFAGGVTLTCSLSTSSAAYAPACAVAPNSVTLTAGGTATATVTVTSTTATTASLDRSAEPLGRRLGGGATLALLLFCLPTGGRRRKLGAIALALVAAAGLGASTGCSSSGGNTVGIQKSSAGTYTLTVIGTSASGATASVIASTTVSVTIK